MNNTHIAGFGALAFDDDPNRPARDPETGERLLAGDAEAEEAVRKILSDVFVLKATHGADAVRALLEKANRLMKPRGMGEGEAGLGPRGINSTMAPRGANDSKPDERRAMLAAGERIGVAGVRRPMTDAEFREYRRCLRSNP